MRRRIEPHDTTGARNVDWDSTQASQGDRVTVCLKAVASNERTQRQRSPHETVATASPLATQPVEALDVLLRLARSKVMSSHSCISLLLNHRWHRQSAPGIDARPPHGDRPPERPERVVAQPDAHAGDGWRTMTVGTVAWCRRCRLMIRGSDHPSLPGRLRRRRASRRLLSCPA
jgi:hypothetical protein